MAAPGLTNCSAMCVKILSALASSSSVSCSKLATSGRLQPCLAALRSIALPRSANFEVASATDRLSCRALGMFPTSSKTKTKQTSPNPFTKLSRRKMWVWPLSTRAERIPFSGRRPALHRATANRANSAFSRLGQGPEKTCGSAAVYASKYLPVKCLS